MNDNVFEMRDVWVVYEKHTSYDLSETRELFTDYDEAILHCEAMEHKAIIEWEARNKTKWDYDKRYYKVVPLLEMIEDYGSDRYDDGHDTGYNEGFREGKSEGRDEGYEDGYSDGVNAGTSSGYDDGFRDGQASKGE